MIKKIIKFSSILFFILFVIIYFVFVNFTATKSDKEVLKPFLQSNITPKLTKQTFNGFEYRKISVVKDTILPTIVFVHGTIGSLSNFSKYLTDSLLQNKANMIAYDRIGYNYKDKNDTQESVAFELELLKDITKNLHKNKLIIVGYSYGGPIALAFKEKVNKIILLAPALYSSVEKIPWMICFYKWKLTRWLVPNIWKQASKEKLSHKKDLQKFEESWQNTSNEVLTIHGENDWIVSYKNSKKLESLFKKEKFKLVPIEDAGHGLVWSNFNVIKQQILTVLDFEKYNR